MEKRRAACLRQRAGLNGGMVGERADDASPSRRLLRKERSVTGAHTLARHCRHQHPGERMKAERGRIEEENGMSARPRPTLLLAARFLLGARCGFQLSTSIYVLRNRIRRLHLPG
ncbi:hypothetical protein EJ06DRAFT_147610 [Trichodelitschia bisporula]|uniref:Uncharacterized protein n=1 Tax=Trichodelitschia bisporula TaxID=703511 RepID=A0A6G1HN28_9PEZI|nr:hypothetical protein EJ06DRAFT_147610 [Trichodelitschia bisporula]